jgi:MFS family permease
MRFTGADPNRALGVWAAIGGIGAAAGVLLGGLLTAEPGWRWIFHINVPVGGLVAIVLPLLVLALPASGIGRRLDIVGGAIVTIATATLSYGILNARPEAGTLAWALPMAVAAALFVLFAIVERRSLSRSST